MLAIILFSFMMFHAVPTDPARLILGPNADEAQVKALQIELGLDKPLYVQFGHYIKNISRLDLGRSYVDQRPVMAEVAARFRVSLVFVTVCMLLVLGYTVFALYMLYLGKSIGRINFMLISTPTFFSGLLVALFSIKFFSFSSFNGLSGSIGNYLFFLPPAFALAVYPMGILTNILTREMQSILKSDYILAARAYAVPERQIFYKFALRGAVIPYLAALSNQLPVLFTGAFILEIIFSIPGVGSLLVKSIFARDFPMIEGILIVNGMIFILINLFFELIYPVVDSRISA